MSKPRAVKTRKAARVITFPVAAILIAVGGALTITGELIGVFDPGPNDTITEAVAWANKKTYGFLNVAILGGLGWMGLHFYGVA